jgi:hypothetical protein
MEEPLKQVFLFPGLPTYDNVYRPLAPQKKKQLNVTPLWPLVGQKFSLYVEGYLEFSGYSNLFIYSTISLGTPNNLMHKPGWKTLGFDMGFVP